ncbi:DUF1576 domain-containing protein [Mangrovicoccus sp. HB161399]|uniref:DUF1576 domain-containing protein n=1 Tax=Mangrovicoccus sp. HB161399 TaxID=2720392 RepID=UPI0015564435|nr:DUF1576 domain-containing protein [Mangrovicoccus sp. HB161399]
MNDLTAAPRRLSGGARLLLVCALAAGFIGWGLWLSGPEGSRDGLLAILAARDTLITDYVEMGGPGGAFLNAGLLVLIAAAVFRLSGAAVSGGAVACLFLVLGAGLFGKNLVNVWPILLGTALYAQWTRVPFASHVATAFFGCALAPVVSELLFSSHLELWQSFPLAMGTGVAAGFVLPPVAAQLFNAHAGMSLYNMGFTVGILGSVLVPLLLFYGVAPEPVFIWSTGYTRQIAPLLLAAFAAMPVIGLAIDRNALSRQRALLAETGRAPADFLAAHGDGAILASMGLLGLAATGYVLAVGGDINGPVTGAILSVAGFGGFGKHLRNILPVAAGVWLVATFGPSSPERPEMVLAALFGTALAPMAGCFGWAWGLAAGACLAAVTQSVGLILGGLSLYGTGFAAGFVAAILGPVAQALKDSRAQRAAAPRL